MQQGAKAFRRMQQKIEYDKATGFRLQRGQGRFPLNLSGAFAAQKQHSYRIRAQKISAVLFGKQSAALFNTSNINAVALPGVFFGRLIRRLGNRPSRRISRPSAAFISVNRLYAQNNVQQFAPMNNPYHQQRAVRWTGFFNLFCNFT